MCIIHLHFQLGGRIYLNEFEDKIHLELDVPTIFKKQSIFQCRIIISHQEHRLRLLYMEKQLMMVNQTAVKVINTGGVQL